MSEKVLLVDDEEDFVQTLAERMRARGMDVATSTSAREAITMAGEENFDVIVLDLQMPGMDGIEALRELKKRQPKLQVILLSGQASLENGVQAMKAGALDFLEKPAKVSVLESKIKKARARKMILVEEDTEERLREIMGERCW